MRLSFDTIDEVKEFVKQLKGTRGPKDKDDGEAGAAPNVPQPMAIPTTGGNPAMGFPAPGPAFAPPVPTAGPTGGAFPAPAATGPAPEVLALVHRINAKLDASPASLTPAGLDWFRGNCGAEAANADWTQIRTVVLPRMTAVALDNIAKLMNA